MTNDKPLTLEEMLKNYKPEPIEYDPEVDGGDEFLVREELLKKKEELKDVVSKLKEKQRASRKVRR